VNLLILDTETTGIDPQKYDVVEVAAAVYHVPTRCVIWQGGGLTPVPAEHAWDPDARRVNGIKDESLSAAARFLLNEQPDPWAQVYQAALSAEVSAIVAHNAEFDRGHAAKVVPEMLEWPWVCSKDDISYPEEKSGRRLDYLCADHGIISIGPFRHRALWDVMLIAALFDRVPDLEHQVLRAMVPRALFRALVSYEDREQAKAAGFSWDGTRRIWVRRLPQDTPTEPTPDRPFRLVRVEGVGEQVGQQVGQAVPKGVA